MRRRMALATYPGTARATPSFPYVVLLRVGFAMPCGVVPARGALLPHRFTITTHPATPVLPHPASYWIRTWPSRAAHSTSSPVIGRSSTGVTGSFGCLLSVALSVGSRRPGVTWHLALWSPDFPRSARAPRDCPADSDAILLEYQP